MENYTPAQPLIEMEKSADFLICIDSDGCVFDTMEVKHKECFIPNTINYWNLQAISKYAREAAEYVNLYSKSRGVNRFPALIEVMELLQDREEVKKRGFQFQDMTPLKKWIASETKLGNPALEEYVKNHPNDALMAQTLAWSAAVNRTVGEVVRGVPPFPYVRESFEKIRGKADVIVVSATPTEALCREWREHDLEQYVKVICGQEMGTKAECIAYARKHGYEDDHILMIGDAPGDLKAARANDALFFPIDPDKEDDSWKIFCEEALDRFFAVTYSGDYEQGLIDAFDACLPTTPPWKR